MEAADGVFADAAEVESIVVFYNVGNLAVAVRWAVLEVFDDPALRVQTEDEGVALWGWLEEFGQTSNYRAEEWVRQ